MQTDRHEVFERTIDAQIVAGISAAEEVSLAEHLEGCAVCRAYLGRTKRAIASLDGFAFEVDRSLDAQVCAAITLRAEAMERTRWSVGRVAWMVLLAGVLTGAGSLVEFALSGWLAPVLEIGRVQVQRALLHFWIVPSLWVLLLFPLLPLLVSRRERVR